MHFCFAPSLFCSFLFFGQMVKPEPDKDEPLLDISKLIHEDFSFEQQLQSTSSLKSGDGEVPYIQKSKSNTPRDSYYFISSPPEEQPPLSKTKTYFFDRRRSREAVNDSSSGVSYFIPLFLLGIILSTDNEEKL